MPRICIQWPRYGPLHLARARVSHEVLSARGYEIVALETASDSSVYDWRLERGPTDFQRVTVFEGSNYDDISPSAMHHSVTAALDTIQPDGVLIHSYSTPDSRAALAWTRRNRRTAMQMAESTRRDAARSRPREMIKKLIVSQFDSAVTSGTRSRAYAEALGIDSRRVFEGYSVVDNGLFRREAMRVKSDRTVADHLPSLADRSPFFLASARFMPRKNLHTLLDAYARYRERGPTGAWRLVLLGDGELRPQLEAFVSSRNLSGVEMPGWRQIEDLPLYYGAASAFVHTAEVDQWGLVVNEAMAAGLPVIVSTGTGCCDDLVEHGENGFAFDPHDSEALAHHMYVVAHEADRESMARRSEEIVARWPLELFATGLQAAFEAGSQTADRGLNPVVGLMVAGLRVLSSSPRSFHSVQD